MFYKILLEQNINGNGRLRDLFFFEVTIEIYVRPIVSIIIQIIIPYELYIDEIWFVLRNIKFSYPNFFKFRLCFNDFKNLVERLKNYHSKDVK